MADDEVVVDESFPIFESIETLHTRSASVNPIQPDVEVGDFDTEAVRTEEPKRRRGRPKGSRNRTTATGSLPISEGEKSNVKGRLAQDVSLRTQQVLKGATSIPAIWRPAFQMHDIEATNIADPLASYATRQAELSPVVAKLVDDFDLVAAIIGIGAYAVRVYKENGEWIAEHANEQRRASGTRQAPMGDSGKPIQENIPTQRPQPAAENGYGSPESITERDPNVSPISIPFIGGL